MIEPPELTLHAADLLAKFGFDDGDLPDALAAYWDSLDICYLQPHPAIELDVRVPWRNALWDLVNAHLLPALAEHHDIEIAFLGWTIHNPVLATRVDGRPLDLRNGGVPDELAEYRWGNAFTPSYVVVPYADVARACGLQP